MRTILLYQRKESQEKTNSLTDSQCNTESVFWYCSTTDNNVINMDYYRIALISTYLQNLIVMWIESVSFWFRFALASSVWQEIRLHITENKINPSVYKRISIQNAPLFVPNHTFLVCFGGISGNFGRAMVRLAKISIARTNEPDMSPKRTKKVRLDIYRTQIRPSDHDFVAISGQWLDISGYQHSKHAFWSANCEYLYSNIEYSQNERENLRIWRAFLGISTSQIISAMDMHFKPFGRHLVAQAHKQFTSYRNTAVMLLTWITQQTFVASLKKQFFWQTLVIVTIRSLMPYERFLLFIVVKYNNPNNQLILFSFVSPCGTSQVTTS